MVLFLLQFNLGHSEFLIGVSGSIGPFGSIDKVITSLTFVTNARSHGPFGQGRGTHFHIPMQSNGCIVGFFARAGRYLNAIGVYTDKEVLLIYFVLVSMVELDQASKGALYANSSIKPMNSAEITVESFRKTNHC
jgi:hypothetical protein